MSGQALLIMLITAIVMAGVGAFLYGQVFKNIQDNSHLELEDSSLRIINVVGQNISNSTMRHVRFSVTATSGAVYLNESFIVIRTQDDVANLQYKTLMFSVFIQGRLLPIWLSRQGWKTPAIRLHSSAKELFNP